MVTKYFNHIGAKHLLAKATYTGIAASLINGKTIHVLCRITQKEDKMLGEMKAKLEVKWSCRKYLILDKYSMLSKTMLSKISKQIGLGKKLPKEPFGRISIILCGNHYQFLFVACKINDTLYWLSDLAEDMWEMTIGEELFQAFKDIVILREQMWVTNLI